MRTARAVFSAYTPPYYRSSVGENMDELVQRITEYAASVDEANKRTLDPIVIELMSDRGLT
jgi:hypothetical protein